MTTRFNISNPPQDLWLGYQGEDNARTIEIDITELETEYPNVACSISFKRAGETSVTPLVTTRIGNIIRWVIPLAITFKAGAGTIVVRGDKEGLIVKTQEIYTNITESHGAEGEAPDPVTDWLNEANSVLDEVADLSIIDAGFFTDI